MRRITFLLVAVSLISGCQPSNGNPQQGEEHTKEESNQSGAPTERLDKTEAAERKKHTSDVIVIGTVTFRGEIYRVNADGSNRQLLTSGGDPALSPDGKRVAFIAGIRAESVLYLINIDGTGRKRIATNTGWPGQPWLAPGWSPDGKQIAFCTLNYGPGAGRGAGPASSSIFILDADGENMRRVGNVQGMFPNWSPDGKRLLCTRWPPKEGLFVVDVDGTNQRELLGDRAAMGAWSPDGESLAYVIRKGSRAGLYVAQADGSESRRMAGGSDEITIGPRWSRDSKRVYFTWMAKKERMNAVGGEPAPSAVHVISVNGQNLRRVTESDAMEYCGPGAWLYLSDLVERDWAMRRMPSTNWQPPSNAVDAANQALRNYGGYEKLQDVTVSKAEGIVSVEGLAIRTGAQHNFRVELNALESNESPLVLVEANNKTLFYSNRTMLRLKDAVESYLLEFGSLPNDLDELVTGPSDPSQAKLFEEGDFWREKEIPFDRWGNKYRMKADPFMIYSIGRNKTDERGGGDDISVDFLTTD